MIYSKSTGVKIKSILFLVVFASTIPLAYADEEGFIEWRFCQEDVLFPYSIANGSLHQTAHLRLYESPTCDDGIPTEFQLQILHTSNNSTDFTLGCPDSLEFESIHVRVLDEISKGKYQVHTFWLDDTVRSVQLNDYTHNQSGLVTVILDFVK